MLRLIARCVALAVWIGLMTAPFTAEAHQEIQLGEYTLEYGWVTEPPMTGQPNAFVLNFTKGEQEHASGTPEAHEGVEVDVSGLKVEVAYGGETTALVLEPVADKPGNYTAAFTPARPGEHTLRLGGTLDGFAVNAEVQPEEVEPATVASSAGFNWAIVAGVGVVLALGVGFVVLRRRRG
jgi:hypothetical protein